MRKLTSACLFGAAILAGGPAFAEEPPAAPQAQPQEEYSNEQIGVRVRRWYGWQTLLVDAAAFGTALAGYSTNDFTANPASTVGIVSYVFGPPIVHWLHGHAGKGAIDLAGRILAPLLIGGLGYLIGLPGGDKTSSLVGNIGLGVAYVGVVTFDAAVMAFEATYDTESALRKPKSPVFTAFPRVELRRGGASLGVSGAF
jgi:hypothetical protein